MKKKVKMLVEGKKLGGRGSVVRERVPRKTNTQMIFCKIREDYFMMSRKKDFKNSYFDCSV